MVEENDPTNAEAVFYSSLAQVHLDVKGKKSLDKIKDDLDTLWNLAGFVSRNYDITNNKLMFEILDDLKVTRGAYALSPVDVYIKNSLIGVTDWSSTNLKHQTTKILRSLESIYIWDFKTPIFRQNRKLSQEEILKRAFDTLSNGYFDLARQCFLDYDRYGRSVRASECKSPVGCLGMAISELSEASKKREYEKANEYVVQASKGAINSETDRKNVGRLIRMTAGTLQRTLLVNAAAFSNYDAVKYLVDLGSEIDAKDNENKTALWYACFATADSEEGKINDRNIAKLLLDKGASVSVISSNGIALYNKDTDDEIASMIRDKYPDIPDPKIEAPTPIIENTTFTNTKSGGCYVATAVYGSYDCPEVWTLRRYRDYSLAETWYGRAFIHAYYAISPTIVKWFGDTDWFKRMGEKGLIEWLKIFKIKVMNLHHMRIVSGNNMNCFFNTVRDFVSKAI